MDPIAIAFYAVICGCLSAVAPNLGGMPVRLTIGAVVGVIAALVLPMVKGMLY
ncbi:MAG: hypothetical protein ACWA47_03430 [Brevirhabdus sp.]